MLFLLCVMLQYASFRCHLHSIFIFSSFSSQYPNLVSSMDLEALTRGEARMMAVFGSDAVPSRGINLAC